MIESRRGYRGRVNRSQPKGTTKKGLDPVAAYLRFRLARMVGDEPG